MSTLSGKITKSFYNSMHKYFDLVIKGWFVLNGRKKQGEGIPLFLITIAGILQALACWIIAEFFHYFFSGSVTVGSSSIPTGISFGAALVASIIIVAALAYTDRGKNLSALSWTGDFFGKWQNSKYEEAAITEHYNVLAMNAVLLCKTLCIASLISKGHSFWIIYVIALSYAAMTSGMSKLGTFAKNDEPDFETFTVVGAFIIITCLFHQHFIPAVICIVIAFFLAKFIFTFIIKKFEHMNEELIRAQAEFIQCILLMAGLIFIR